MGAPGLKHRLSYSDYLALEQASEIKHEFHAGEIFAMSGGTAAHSFMGARCINVLGNALGPGRCRVFSSDARIYVADVNEGCYPDLSIVCGRVVHDPRDRDGITNPVAVVEVLSPGTESWDRGGKFARYKRLSSLRDYVLVTVDSNRVGQRAG